MSAQVAFFSSSFKSLVNRFSSWNETTLECYHFTAPST